MDVVVWIIIGIVAIVNAIGRSIKKASDERAARLYRGPNPQPQIRPTPASPPAFGNTTPNAPYQYQAGQSQPTSATPYGQASPQYPQTPPPYPAQPSYPNAPQYQGQQPPYPGQSPYAAPVQYPGQMPYPGQAPYPVAAQYPGQAPYPAAPAYPPPAGQPYPGQAPPPRVPQSPPQAVQPATPQTVAATQPSGSIPLDPMTNIPGVDTPGATGAKQQQTPGTSGLEQLLSRQQPLLAAIIMQEVLAPPLSRRAR